MKKKLVRILMLAAALAALTVSALAAETSETTQLAAPSKLQWNGNGDLSFHVNSPTQNIYAIKIYNAAQNDDPVLQATHDFGADNKATDHVLSLFREGYWRDPYYEDHPEEAPGDYNMDSGTYYFTIQALGDGKSYSDSKVVTSSEWTYTKPATALTTPMNLRWENGYAKWDAPDDYEGGYMVDFYYVEADGKKIGVGGVSCNQMSGTEELLDEWLLEDRGAGDYCFAVRALSKDITKTCNSPWSAYSGIYHVDEVSSGVRSELDDLLDTYEPAPDTGTLTEQDAAKLKDALANMDTDQLWTAIAADTGAADGVIEKLTELEELVGGPAAVSVSADGPSMNADDISIVGANLNDWDSKPTLKIGKADPNTVIPEQYSNTVQFSMKLDDGTATTGAQELAVPVRITMPIPANINPAFLAILHYHQDGSYEEITSPYTFSEGGKWYVSFVVTGFSDFALAELPYTADEKTGALIVNAPANTQTVMAAVYDGTGRMLACTSAAVSDGTARVTMELDDDTAEAAATLKLFWLGADYQPVRAACTVDLSEQENH